MDSNENPREESTESGVGAAVLEDSDQEIAEPPKYAVLLLNDDYTTMEFVIEVLQRFFKKSKEEAARIMLRVHQQGKGVAGIYPFDIAETKAHQVRDFAQSRGYPLRCEIEPVE